MDDSTTVQRCLEGDPEAFRTLVERYQGRALGHAVAVLRSRDDAQDAVQEAFLAVHRSLHTFDRNRVFYPWLYAILRNACFKVMARRRLDEAADPAFRLDLLESPGMPADERLALERALAALAPADREVVMLRHLDGLSYAELAAWLQIPVGTVMSRLFNARKRLRDGLSRGLPPEEIGGRER